MAILGTQIAICRGSRTHVAYTKPGSEAKRATPSTRSDSILRTKLHTPY